MHCSIPLLERPVLSVVIGSMFLVLAPFSVEAAEKVRVRVVSVLDGDTVSVRDSKNNRFNVLLQSIVIPRDEPFASESRRALTLLLGGKEAVVELARGKDGVLRGTFFIGGKDMNATMVYHGFAWGEFNAGYARLQEDAKKGKRGLWRDRTAESPKPFRNTSASSLFCLFGGLIVLAVIVTVLKELPSSSMRRNGCRTTARPLGEDFVRREKWNRRTVSDNNRVGGSLDSGFPSTAEWRGKLGEEEMRFILEHGLSGDGETGYRIIQNLMLETPTGTTQLDFTIVSAFGIFIIEVKNYSGWIFGSPDQAFWTQCLNGGRKFRFQNPLRQNFKHFAVLSEKTGVPRNVIFPVVAFSNDSEFKTEMPANVVHFDAVVDYIKQFRSIVILPEQVKDIVENFLSWDSIIDQNKKERHVENLRKTHEPASIHESLVLCPICGNRMVLFRGKNNGKPFWGCSKYPGCRGRREAIE